MCPTGCGGTLIPYVFVHPDGSQSPGLRCSKCAYETH